MPVNPSSFSYSRLLEKLNFFAALLFVFWLPLFDGYLPTIFGIWVLFWLLQGRFKARFHSFHFKSGLFLALISYFVLSLVAVVYTKNSDRGYFDAQQKLAFVVFPLLLAGMPQLFWRNLKWVFFIFLVGLFVASVYDIALAVKASFIAGQEEGVFQYWIWKAHSEVGFFKLIGMRTSRFSYSNLSLLMHPSYFALYLLFGMGLLFYLNRNRIQQSYLVTTLKLILLILFLVMIYLLQSKAGLVSLGISLVLLPLFKGNRFRKKIARVYLLVIFLLGLSFLVVQKQKIQTVISEPEKHLSTSSLARLDMWQTAYSLWKESPVWGIGPGDLREAVQAELLTQGKPEYATGELNLHNQFLETVVGLGLLGFMSLVAIFGFSLKLAYNMHNKILFYLLLLFLINFYFESVLNRQSGLYFFLFFLSLFAFNPNQNTPPLKSNNSRLNFP